MSAGEDRVSSNRSVGVALSGGGHRATAWAVGALLYLADSGRNSEVTSITSVSGGSIANGYLAHEADFEAVDGTQMRAVVAPLLRHVAHEGLFFFGRPTNRYVVGLLTLVGLVVVGLLVWILTVLAVVLGHAGWFETVGWDAPGWLVEPGWLAPWTAVLVIATVVAAVLFARRSSVVDQALAKTHFSTDGQATLLRDIDRRVDHVLCATELQAANHMYLAPRFVYSYEFGLGTPGPLRLSTAVQASACLPGAFRPRRLPTEPHELDPPEHAQENDRPAPEFMVLTDGGVYDNMADQWHQGFAARARAWPELRDHHVEADELVVVNASEGWAWAPVGRWGLLRGELQSLLRAKSVMYDVTTAHRRQGLVGRFDRAALEGEGLVGALVHIPQSPWDIADRWTRSHSWPDRAQRARRVLELLESGPLDEDAWKEMARENAEVPTVLRALEEETTVDLLYHAYTLAMCNLHIILDYPLLDLPDRESLRGLVAKENS